MDCGSAPRCWAAVLHAFFGTGALGGLTTFSTYRVDMRRLVDGGRAGIAVTYLAATGVAAPAAVTATAGSTRWIVPKWSAR